MPNDLKQKLEFFLPLLWLPSLVQIVIELHNDPWNVKPIRFLVFNLPPYHMITLAILILLGIAGYYYLLNIKFIKRLIIIFNLTFLSIMAYESIWNIFNLFRVMLLYNDISFNTLITRLPYFCIITAVGFLIILSRITKVSISRGFVVLSLIEIILFSTQIGYITYIFWN